MKTASLYKGVRYHAEKPSVEVILESDFSREIRIAFKENQRMKEHKSRYPIIVQLAEGSLDFGVNGQVLSMEKGDMICLEGGVPHDLHALSDSIVRLSISIRDHSERVKAVANL
ncbi:MAG: cupin domain-containing protein [Bacteroidota bacterium]